MCVLTFFNIFLYFSCPTNNGCFITKLVFWVISSRFRLWLSNAFSVKWKEDSSPDALQLYLCWLKMEFLIQECNKSYRRGKNDKIQTATLIRDKMNNKQSYSEPSRASYYINPWFKISKKLRKPFLMLSTFRNSQSKRNYLIQKCVIT